MVFVERAPQENAVAVVEDVQSRVRDRQGNGPAEDVVKDIDGVLQEVQEVVEGLDSALQVFENGGVDLA